jgi:predicted metalloprotease with PDZ domain
MNNNELALKLRRWQARLPVLAILILPVTLVSPAAAGKDPKSKSAMAPKAERTVVVEQKGAFFGITMQELDEAVREGLNTSAKNGVLVTEVIEDSPAAKAGVEDGDIIVEFEGKNVESADQLRELIAAGTTGDKVSVTLVRGKAQKEIEVTLGDWADQPMALFYDGSEDGPWHHLRGFANAMVWPGRLGVRVSELNADLGSYFGVNQGEGVLVLDVDKNSTAEAVGLKGGDVIVKVEGDAVKSPQELRERMSEVDEGDELTVTVMRNKKTLELKGAMKETEGASWFRSHGPRLHYAPSPDNDELRKEMDQLRKEIDELKKELKKS